MLLSSVIPSISDLNSHLSVLIRGVGSDFYSVPLHQVYLDSDFKTGFVEVGIVPNLPIGFVHSW